MGVLFLSAIVWVFVGAWLLQAAVRWVGKTRVGFLSALVTNLLSIAAGYGLELVITYLPMRLFPGQFSGGLSLQLFPLWMVADAALICRRSRLSFWKACLVSAIRFAGGVALVIVGFCVIRFL